MIRSLPLFLPPLLLASACTVGPDYHAPETRAAPEWLEAGAPGQVDLTWWDRFGDPQLSALVRRAVASSPDLKEAQGRLAEARANREAIAGGRLPSVTATGSGATTASCRSGASPFPASRATSRSSTWASTRAGKSISGGAAPARCRARRHASRARNSPGAT